MQAVALMPHHHHGSSDSVCINYSHINFGSDCDDVCTGDHKHDAHPYTSCTSHNIVIVQPDSREERVEEIAADLPDCSCGLCIFDFVGGENDDRLASIRLSEYGDQTDHESYLRVYITTALPCRAPDFVC